MGNYAEAFGAIVQGYGMDDIIKNNFTVAQDPKMQAGVLTTGGQLGKKQTITFNPKTLIAVYHGSIDWEFIVTGIFHEMMHVYQRETLMLADHNEREFQAYYFSLTGSTYRFDYENGGIKLESIMDNIEYAITIQLNYKEQYFQKVKGYYSRMSPTNQKKYEKFYKDLKIPDKP